jgi:hypothetical protein
VRFADFSNLSNVTSCYQGRVKAGAYWLVGGVGFLASAFAGRVAAIETRGLRGVERFGAVLVKAAVPSHGVGETLGFETVRHWALQIQRK